MRFLILLVLLASLPVAAAEPQFRSFPAKSVFRGVPARVDFASSPGSRMFRTRLIQGAARGPNYAGNLTVVSWGCGTNCLTVAVLSARSGKILTFLQTCGGIDYKLDSTLLIANPPDPSPNAYPAACKTEFYEFANHRLKSIGSRPTSG